MKKYICVIIVTVMLFAGMLLAANIILQRNSEKSLSDRNIFINRTVSAVNGLCSEKGKTLTDEEINAALKEIYTGSLNEYDPNQLPIEIYFCPFENSDKISSGGGRSISIRTVNIDTECVGFIIFVYEDIISEKTAVIMNVCMIISFAASFGVLIYIYFRIIKPFNILCEYPVKLSKGGFTEKIPEMKNRYFGKFIWGINMLRDRLEGDRKHINRLMKDKQTMMTSIAHGIKTPVANIRLYSEAIEGGLYRRDGIPDEDDAEIARKIEKNAEDITVIVKEMIAASSEGIIDFEPVSEQFYSKEITEYILDEYSNRLNVLRVPFEVKCISNVIVSSDKSGVCRIVSQLMENAIKYGNGEGVTFTAEKQEDGIYFTLRNKGVLIPESELPYIWGSFWRGSNAEGIEGSGIGLFEARKIAGKLSGEILCKRVEETGEMEFVLYIP